jgi:hypothetical protein
MWIGTQEPAAVAIALSLARPTTAAQEIVRHGIGQVPGFDER